MDRVIGSFVSIAVLSYLVVLAPAVVRDFRHCPTWTVLTVACEVAAVSAVVVGVRRRDARLMTAALLAFAVVYVVSDLAWRPLWDGEMLTDGWRRWHSRYLAVVSIALTPSLPPARVWAAQTGLALLTALVDSGGVAAGAATNALAAWVVSGSAVYIALHLRGLARDRDAEETEARQAAMAASAAESQVIERERVDGLIHDSVLSVLLSASRSSGGEEVTSAARHALTRLAELREGDDETGAIASEVLVTMVRNAVAFVDPGAEVVVRDHPRSPQRCPESAVRAVVAATTEAARNCALHTGDAGHRVAIDLRAGDVVIEISDDGPGFDPEAIPPARMGVRQSILGRMRRVEGGWAEVRSTPGAGTVVEVGWRR